ncbi:MAG: hypothetical protein J1F23_06960 [Oscillospiraceae bacterium]|nr:hypothetical protein [Oscillospiraceae bacterium]
MWRIKKLTELFGVVGEGWYYEKIKEENLPLVDGRVIYTVDINLFYKMDNGEWSKAILGTGGATLVTYRYKQLHIDDDAKKKALTDAISVCCKALGIGADVYWSQDISKYGELGDFAPVELPAPNAQPQSQSGAKQSQSAMVQQMNAITDDNTAPITVAQNAVADAIQKAQQPNEGNMQNTGFVTIDPATTPIPTVQEAENYTLEGSGQYKGYKLGAIFTLAANGDKTAAGWLNWLSTAATKSENIAWAKFYAEFLRNHYLQQANNAAQNQSNEG